MKRTVKIVSDAPTGYTIINEDAFDATIHTLWTEKKATKAAAKATDTAPPPAAAKPADTTPLPAAAKPTDTTPSPAAQPPK